MVLSPQLTSQTSIKKTNMLLTDRKFSLLDCFNKTLKYTINDIHVALKPTLAREPNEF